MKKGLGSKNTALKRLASAVQLRPWPPYFQSFIDKFNRDLHFATKCRIFRFEFIDFHDPFIRHELDEAAVVSVRVRGGFADASRRVIGEGNSEFTSNTGSEGVHVTGHSHWHFPDCNRVQQSQGTRP